MVSETKSCVACGTTFTFQYDGNELGNILAKWRVRCEPCAEMGAAIAEEIERVSETKAKEERWLKVCPPLYADTDTSHPKLGRPFLTAAMQWTPDGSRGLGFLGKSGSGKTRCLYLALRRAFDAGLWCEAISHNAFSKLVISAFSGEGEERRDAQKGLERLRSVGVLLIDDIGKAPATERADAELEELVEARAAQKRPLLWSANGSGEWLAKRFGADRGEPIVRRLAEFSEIVIAR